MAVDKNCTALCPQCAQEKPLSEFSKDSKKKSGYTTKCKKCRNEVTKQWVLNNQERVKELNLLNKGVRKEYYSRPEVKLKNRKAYIEKSFGIKYEEYERLYAEQGGKCAICLGDEPCARNEHLCIDHCHDTGKIRALLCSSCNRALGLLKDSVEILEKAKNYLITHMKGYTNENQSNVVN